MRRAFVLGSNGPAAYKPLKYARNDVENISQALRSENCRYEVWSPDMGTTVLEVRQALFAAVEACAPEDVFVCYFSGHGFLDRGSLFLLWEHTDINRLLSTAIPASLITLSLAHCKARNKLLVLDCCHAGAVATLPGTKSEAEMAMEEAIVPDNYLVLMASKRLEKARELDSLQGSFLTANVCAALTDQLLAADKDLDGRLSYPDLQKWLEEQAVQYNQANPEEPVPYPHWFGKTLGDFFFTEVSPDFSRRRAIVNFLPNPTWSEAAIIQFGNRDTITADKEKEQIEARIQSLLSLLLDSSVQETKKTAVITAICALVGYGTEVLNQALEQTYHTANSDSLKMYALKALRILKTEMVYIPGGKIKQSDGSFTSCEGFYIDKYPVTNQQFRQFASDTKYEVEGSWPLAQQPDDKSDHPVTHITFQDASEFANWAYKRLPAEVEWIRAAYGNSPQLFPWGNDFEPGRCNTAEAEIGTTCSVYCFPNGVSQFGVFNLAGNVWEWIDQGKKLSRMIRGGSWKMNQHDAGRNSLRTPNLLASGNDLGFRCVRPPFLNLE